MLVDVKALVSNLAPIAIVSTIAIATKIFGCGIAAKTSGSGWKDSLVIGLGMILAEKSR